MFEPATVKPILKVVVDEPRFNALTVEPVEAKVVIDKLKLAVLKVPCTKVIVLAFVNAEPKVHSPPAPFNVIALTNATPLVVMVNPVVVAANVRADVNVLVTPVAARINEP
jgi:hypothetical protein